MPIDDIKWGVLDIKGREEDIVLARDYYNGDHRLAFATAKWRSNFTTMFEHFRDNLCPAVVDAKADRIQIEGLSVPGNEQINSIIAEIWRREKMQQRAGEIVKMSLKEGDSFLLVWPDLSGKMRWYIQRSDRMAVQWYNDDDIELALKVWPVNEYLLPNEKTKWRAAIYYEDRVERYITRVDYDTRMGNGLPDDPKSWEEFNDREDPDGDSTGAVIPHLFGRVPVFPFCNNSDPGTYGVSDLKDVIPIQDALNKSLADLLVSGEFNALPQRWIAGIEVETDSSGVAVDPPWKTGLDRIMAVANPSAKFGEFSAADLEAFLKVQDSFRREIGIVSRTPLHHLLMSGDFPSGAALAALERPLTAVVNDREAAWGLQLEQAMALTLLSEGQEVDAEAINANWVDTEWHDPATMAEEWRVKKELGVPDEQLWKEMGYDTDQIEEFKAAKEERKAEMQASFDAGVGGIANPEATNGTAAAPFIQAS